MIWIKFVSLLVSPYLINLTIRNGKVLEWFTSLECSKFLNYRSWNLLIAVLGCTHCFRCAVCLVNQIMFSVDMIIFLVLKFDSHKPDRLGVMLFTNSVTESVHFLNKFQKLHCLSNLMLQLVRGRYQKVVDVFAILLVLKFHNHRPDSIGVMNFTNCLLCSVHYQNRFWKL
jgi:hypothetical protein